MVRLTVMGRLRVKQLAGSGHRELVDQKPLLVVAYLALTPGHRARRDHVAELLWPGGGHASSRRSLRQALYTLSKQMGQTLVESDGVDIWLSGAVASCDVWDLEEAAGKSDHERVVELTARPVLETMSRGLGHEFQEWVDLQSQRARAARREALRALIDRAARSGELEEAEAHARAWIESEPLAEEPRKALVRILKAAGDDAAAYQVYEEYRSLLRSAVDDEPSRELAESVRDVRSVLLAEEGWRPLRDAKDERTTRRSSNIYAFLLVVGAVLLGGGAVAFMAGDWTAREGPSPVIPPAFGGGQLVFTTGTEYVALLPAADAGVWIERPTDSWPDPDPQRLRGPIRLPDDRLVWARRTRQLASAPHPVVRLNGRDYPLRFDGGDVGWALPAPDGRRFVASVERVGADPYAEDLVLFSADWVRGGEGAEPPRLLYRAPSALASYAWAPDGLAIAATAKGPSDRVVVVRPDGSLYREFAFPDVLRFSWCGDSGAMVALVHGDAGRRVVWIDVPSGTTRPMVDSARGEALACSPDGSAVAYAAAHELRLWLFVREVASGAVHGPIRELASSRPHLTWVPDDVAGAVTRLEIDGGDRRLTWGARARLSVSFGGLDQRPRPASVEWRSLHPDIVNVNRDGILFANRAGRTAVVASLHGWVADTVEVVVGGEQPPELWLQDSFEALDPGRWIVAADPEPVAVRTGREAGLWLRGDGRYADGIVTRESFSLAEGARLIVEFRFAPSRPTGERFQACLRDQAEEPAPEANDMGVYREAMCLVYPAEELGKFDPGVARLHTASGFREDFPLEPDAEAWRRATLGVAVDGVPWVEIDGRRVARGDLRLLGADHATWRISLNGASTEPRLLVRNVSLWLGPPH